MATSHSHHHRVLVWIATAYAAVIAIVLYPAFHEELGPRLLLWNCIPPTFGLLAIAAARDKSRPRRIVSATFAILTAIATICFSAAWFFTPLDLDPHSGTTKLVLTFAPIFLLGLATIASGVAWLVTRLT